MSDISSVREISSTESEVSSNDSLLSSPGGSKCLDLDSYFSDLPVEKLYSGSGTSTKSRPRKPIFARTLKRRVSNRKFAKPKKSNVATNCEGDDYVNQRWNQMLERQKQTEAEVKKAILSRERLHPFELSKWLDSEDTCYLPVPSLGVQLRMVEKSSSASSSEN